MAEREQLLHPVSGSLTACLLLMALAGPIAQSQKGGTDGGFADSRVACELLCAANPGPESQAGAPAPSERIANRAPSELVANERHARAGLIAWRDTFAQWLMALSVVPALGISAWGVWLVGRTLTLTREMSTEEHRPWISVSNVEVSHVAHMGNGLWNMFVFATVVTNGSRPASEAAIGGLMGLDRGHRIENQTRLGEAMLGDESRGGLVTTPGTPKRLVSAFFFEPEAAGEDGFIGYFGGWIRYRFSGSDENHVTPFVYQIAFDNDSGDARLGEEAHQLTAT